VNVSEQICVRKLHPLHQQEVMTTI